MPDAAASDTAHAGPVPPRPHRPRLTRGGALVIAAIVLAAVLGPSLGSYHVYVLALVAIQVIAVLSLNLLMGYAGQVSLGQAAFVGMGAFGAADLASWGVPFPFTILLVVGLTTGAAAIVGLPSLRIRGLHLAVTTLAFGLAAEVLLFARPWRADASMGASLPRPELVSSDVGFLWLVLAMLVVVLVVDSHVRRSRIGRAFLAVRDREDTAPARGIPVGVTKLTAYAISGAYAGVAGSLYAYLLERVTPEPFGIWASLEYVAAAVVGGSGSWAGASLAAGAFTALPELLRDLALYAPLLGAVLLAIVPAVAPSGLGGLLGAPLRRSPRRSLQQRPPTSDSPGGVEVAAAELPAPHRRLVLDLPVRTLLEIDDVQVSFGGLDVLTGVDVDVRRGSIVGLIGPNGAGKTTLFNCVSGFVTPDGGSIRYLGRELVGTPRHTRAGLGIGRTFQQPGLGPNQTVLANVLLGQHVLSSYDPLSALARTRRVRRVEAELVRRARVALRAVGLEGVEDLPASALPQMQQRLVEIAAAVAARPRLLLLDEPAAGVSPDEAEELARRLRWLHDVLDLTTVVIEHHVPMVASLCDEVFVLAQGRVISRGTPDLVQRDPEVQRVYLGESPDAEPNVAVEEVARV